MTTVLAIITALGAVFAWIYHLINQNGNLKSEIAEHRAKALIQEWSDRVKDLEGKINEDTRDYENAKKNFTDNSNPPPSGAV